MRNAVLALALLGAPATPPAPSAPLPERPAAVAAALAGTTASLESAITVWRTAPRPRAETPRDVTLWALHQQRLFLALTYDEELGRRAWPLLSREARETLAARRRLVNLTPPTRLPPNAFRTGPPAPAASLLRWYREAERRFGVDWEVLAAVNFVESGFGRLKSASSAGAQGPMQFLAATWRSYGLGGDVDDPHDAILGAANYLRASGAARDVRRALYSYNHSNAYVDAVVRFAAQMRRDERIYFAYHSWQVFIKTPAGPRRITGP
ncbi:MAG TPA: lytic transglycosylase domain-containing protein [Gaiellaceae bacterium]|nr:lytic transglycosylase domain-containing protein [Gaiellaceae bacterium]